MNHTKAYKIAFALSLITVFYNIVEGLVSVYFGFEDESLSLMGFGVDSFIEVLSGIGVSYMIIRIWKNKGKSKTGFEINALKITGFSLILLSIGIVINGFYNLYLGKKPETTFWGIVISLISIITMWILIVYKKKVGRILNSDAILADAECTKICIYMSIALLAGSIAYEALKLPYIDEIGSFIIAYYAFNEGRECFEKAKSKDSCSCSCCR